MEIKINVTKKKHLNNNGEYLIAEIFIDNKWFKEVIPEQSKPFLSQMMECVTDSLRHDEDFINYKF